MALQKNFFLLLLAAFILSTISSCYDTPVRHLASDVALLKVGQSTEEDVLVFLGEPDEQQEVQEGVVMWLYNDKEMTFLEKAPLIGKRLGSPEYKSVVVTMTNKIVTEVIYSSSDADDMDWADDYSWQEKEE